MIRKSRHRLVMAKNVRHPAWVCGESAIILSEYTKFVLHKGENLGKMRQEEQEILTGDR